MEIPTLHSCSELYYELNTRKWLSCTLKHIPRYAIGHILFRTSVYDKHSQYEDLLTHYVVFVLNFLLSNVNHTVRLDSTTLYNLNDNTENWNKKP